MVRVANEVWKIFEFNLGRARALALAQHYLEILAREGEDAAKAYVNDVMRVTLGLLGFDLNEMMARVTSAVQGPLIAEFERYFKEHEDEIKERVTELNKLEGRGGIPDELQRILDPI